MKNVTFKWQVRNANALVTTKTPRPSSRAFLSVEDNFLCHDTRGKIIKSVIIEDMELEKELEPRI